MVIGEAQNAKELFEKYFTLKPDIILVDITMPGGSGIEAVKEILEKDQYAKALFLSMHEEEEYVYKVLKVGGFGLVNKNIMDEELFMAIEKVRQGQKYFGSKWNEITLRELMYDYDISKKGNLIDSIKLNFREEQILELIVRGIKSKDIADKLFLSKKSVDYYRSSICKKLDFHTQAELIKFGIEYFNKKK
jgi:two-component system response regulator NreC